VAFSARRQPAQRTQPAATDTTPRARDPLCRSVADLAVQLSRAGGREITDAMIAADIKAGAPVQPDGTVHLLNYGAWLAKEFVRDGDRSA
jgi:hypothetical protein